MNTRTARLGLLATALATTSLVGTGVAHASTVSHSYGQHNEGWNMIVKNASDEDFSYWHTSISDNVEGAPFLPHGSEVLVRGKASEWIDNGPANMDVAYHTQNRAGFHVYARSNDFTGKHDVWCTSEVIKCEVTSGSWGDDVTVTIS